MTELNQKVLQVSFISVEGDYTEAGRKNYWDRPEEWLSYHVTHLDEGGKLPPTSPPW